MNKNIKTTSPTLALPLLQSMSRDDLRAVATNLGVPRGKNREDTIANLADAVEEGKAHIKANWTISFKPADGSKSRETYFVGMNRTYISGPGKGNEVIFVAPAKGKPAPVADADEAAS